MPLTWAARRPPVRRHVPHSTPHSLTCPRARDRIPARSIAFPQPWRSSMSMLPSGTVTFLFTDIEGSTRLWEQHPRAMELALAQHHALLREAIEAHGGVVFQIIGDAF